MIDAETTDGCAAHITGQQRETLAQVMYALRVHQDPVVQEQATRLAGVVIALYEQLIAS